MSLKAFKYRLYPTPAQERQMFQGLNVCRNGYNRCLAERKWAWELERHSVTKSQQERTGIEYRKTFPQAQVVFSQTMQTVCDDVGKAYQAFFRRVKAGEKAGYPRFKGREHFHSFAFKQFGVGAKLDGRRLKRSGIGRVRVRWQRLIEGEIKTVRIVHKAGQWYACFTCEVSESVPLTKTGRVVGLDVGISALLTTSDGEQVENPHYSRAAPAKLRRVQRSLARKKKGGKNRRKTLRTVQRQPMHPANQRSDMLHKRSTELVQTGDGIALEDLSIRSMVRNHHLSKSILDSGWGRFKQSLTYKAASAGREIRLINPAYPSKCCSNCGTVFQNFDRSTRWVKCACGLSLDRDHNAAINILRKAGWDPPVVANVECALASKGHWLMRRTRSPRL